LDSQPVKLPKALYITCYHIVVTIIRVCGKMYQINEQPTLVMTDFAPRHEGHNERMPRRVSSRLVTGIGVTAAILGMLGVGAVAKKLYDSEASRYDNMLKSAVYAPVDNRFSVLDCFERSRKPPLLPDFVAYKIFKDAVDNEDNRVNPYGLKTDSTLMPVIGGKVCGFETDKAYEMRRDAVASRRE
jgi:hypothetical protein